MFGMKREKRATVFENGSVKTSDPRIAAIFGGFLGGLRASSGVRVTTEAALGVPAVWAAVNFIAGTLAGLPLDVYRRTGEGRERVKGGLQSILHEAVVDDDGERISSFEWRKWLFEQVLTGGRGLSYIERGPNRQVKNIWPMDPNKVTIKRKNGRRRYIFKDGSKRVEYSPDEVIDLPFMLRADGLSHRSPIASCRDAIGLAIAATKYGSRFFENGGVPPFAVTGQFKSAGAMQRAADDLEEAVKEAVENDRQALTLPKGLEIKAIGVDPEKMQLVELQRFSIEQIARIYSLPPVFLQDLTHGTFANTEQQDLHFVKHTIKRWAEQFEQELNLKLFGRGGGSRFVEFNVDGLLRGDFKTRTEGFAKAINTGWMTPNEVRRKNNLPDEDGGDALLIQGATIPLTMAGQVNPPPAPATSQETDDDA